MSCPLRDLLTPEDVNVLRHFLRTLERREKVTVNRQERDHLLLVLPAIIDAWDTEGDG